VWVQEGGVRTIIRLLRLLWMVWRLVQAASGPRDRIYRTRLAMQIIKLILEELGL
jgi:hypothetical protein